MHISLCDLPTRNGLRSAKRYRDWIPDSQDILPRPYFQSVRLKPPVLWNDPTIEIIANPPNTTRVAAHSLKYCVTSCPLWPSVRGWCTVLHYCTSIAHCRMTRRSVPTGFEHVPPRVSNREVRATVLRLKGVKLNTLVSLMRTYKVQTISWIYMCGEGGVGFEPTSSVSNDTCSTIWAPGRDLNETNRQSIFTGLVLITCLELLT